MDLRINENAMYLIKYAKINSIKITPILQNIATKLNINLYGLKYCIKDFREIYFKINNNRIIDDALRYTFIISDNQNFQNIVNKVNYILNKNNIYLIKTKNYFCDNYRYKAFHQIYSYNNFIFEIQFHTNLSIKVSEKLKTLYKKYKKLLSKLFLNDRIQGIPGSEDPGYSRTDRFCLGWSLRKTL